MRDRAVLKWEKLLRRHPAGSSLTTFEKYHKLISLDTLVSSQTRTALAVPHINRWPTAGQPQISLNNRWLCFCIGLHGTFFLRAAEQPYSKNTKYGCFVREPTHRCLSCPTMPSLAVPPCVATTRLDRSVFASLIQKG